MIKVNKNILFLRREYQGEMEEIWNTESITINDALMEMDEEITENGFLVLETEEGKQIDSKSWNGGY